MYQSPRFFRQEQVIASQTKDRKIRRISIRTVVHPIESNG